MLQIILLGLGVGLLVGLMGIGGGVVLVPALAYLLQMSQHLAQGTSLLIQLPPIGLGALYLYRQKGQVDFRVGMVCAAGFLLGGYLGSRVAIALPNEMLRACFGVFLMVAAILMLRKPNSGGARNG